MRRLESLFSAYNAEIKVAVAEEHGHNLRIRYGDYGRNIHPSAEGLAEVSLEPGTSGGATCGRAPSSGAPHRADGGAWLHPAGRGCAANADGRSHQVQRDRRR